MPPNTFWNECSVFIIELVLLHFQVQYIECVLVLFLISLGKAHTHPYHIHCISRNKPSRSDSTNASDWVLFACTLIFIRTLQSLTFAQFFETLRSLTVHFPFKMNSHFDVLQLDKDIERSSRETLGWITKKNVTQQCLVQFTRTSCKIEWNGEKKKLKNGRCSRVTIKNRITSRNRREIYVIRKNIEIQNKS